MSRRCDLLEVGVMSGNNVSHSNRKTRRKFLPNLRQISFASESLGVSINLKVAASTLRTINKYGNIDNFLINYRFNKLSELGQKLRNKVTKALIKKGQFENLKLKTRKFTAVKEA
jgi:large subunit ribosomal protein L28